MAPHCPNAFGCKFNEIGDSVPPDSFSMRTLHVLPACEKSMGPRQLFVPDAVVEVGSTGARVGWRVGSSNNATGVKVGKEVGLGISVGGNEVAVGLAN